MTGEISLRGKVLPIGGLKEKTMAAYKAGIKTVIIPNKNVPDLNEIDKTVRQSLDFVPVSDLKQVFDAALIKDGSKSASVALNVKNKTAYAAVRAGGYNEL